LTLALILCLVFRTTLGSVDLPLQNLRPSVGLAPAPGINLPRDPNLNLDFFGYNIDLPQGMDWDPSAGLAEGELEFSSGLEHSRSHIAREEDITLHEYHDADRARIEEPGEGELAFEGEGWEEGQGLLFDEPVVEEKSRSRSGSGGYPRRTDIGELITGEDP
jgi:hypothetical protein